MIDHAMRSAGANTRLISDHALELLWRATRGITRTASLLLRTSLSLAHERDLSFVDDDIMTAAIDELALAQPTAIADDVAAPTATPEPKPRAKPGTTSRR